MANCSFVNVGTVVHTANVGYPASLAAGDLILLCAFKKSTSGGWSTPSGFTSRKTQRSSDSFGFGQVWTKIADGTESGTVSITATPDAAYMIAWRPATNFAFVETPDAVSGATSRTAPSITPTQTDDLLLYILGATSNVNPGTITSPATMTNRVNTFHNSFYYVYLAELLDYTTTSATGTISPSTSGTSSLSMDFLFKINSTLDVVTPSFAGTSSLSATFRELHRITLTLAGTSSLSATVTASHGTTRNITLTLAGTSSLTTHVSQPHIHPTFAGTSSLTAIFYNPIHNLHVTFAGRSSLTVGPYDIGPGGGRLSQVALETLVSPTDAEVRLSQVTVEVLRARTGGHIWYKR